MATLAKEHYYPDPEKRKKEGYFHPLYKYTEMNKKKFERVEDILDEMTCDVANGHSKTDIIQKLERGAYPNQKGKGLSSCTAHTYYDCVMQRLKVDRTRDVEQARDILWSRYEGLLSEAIDSGNRIEAKAILDSMAKFMGLDKQPQTAIQINNTDKEGITINFGFAKEEEDV